MSTRISCNHLDNTGKISIIMVMKKSCRLLALIMLALLTSCRNPFANPFGGGDDNEDEGPPAGPVRVIEPADKYALAIGGVAPGRDELVIFDDRGHVRDFGDGDLSCEAEGDILILDTRPGYDSVAAGSGVKMIAIGPGVTAVRCRLNGSELSDVYEVTIPPQNLIQILVAEAAEQIADEADLDDDDVVKIESQSPTANALGAVIRNRVDLINMQDDPELFLADAGDYGRDPPASYYDAVILAEGQFSPVDEDDQSHEIFEGAQDRNFLGEDWLVAYDQAVLTAAGIYNGDVEDPTGGAFAFRSPTEGEWEEISLAAGTYNLEIPQGAGFTDETFPQLAPIQLLVHPDVWRYGDGRPSFIFARRRGSSEPAITAVP